MHEVSRRRKLIRFLSRKVHVLEILQRPGVLKTSRIQPSPCVEKAMWVLWPHSLKSNRQVSFSCVVTLVSVGRGNVLSCDCLTNDVPVWRSVCICAVCLTDVKVRAQQAIHRTEHVKHRLRAKKEHKHKGTSENPQLGPYPRPISSSSNIRTRSTTTRDRKNCDFFRRHLWNFGFSPVDLSGLILQGSLCNIVRKSA